MRAMVMAVPLALTLVSAPAFSESRVTGWGKLKFGMSLSEFQKEKPCKISTAGPVKGWTYCTCDDVLNGVALQAQAAFEDDRLVQLEFSRGASDNVDIDGEFLALLRLTIRKYGAPTASVEGMAGNRGVTTAVYWRRRDGSGLELESSRNISDYNMRFALYSAKASPR
jgi:hypothetical protein